MGRALAIAATITTVVTSAVFVTAGTAAADPSANDWLQLRQCESSNRYDINTGNGYYGAYQFVLSTWQSVGGSGYPNDAAPAEQDYRALILYRDRGWEPWTCATIVGLSEDSDANTGVAPPVAGNQSSGNGSSGASEGADVGSSGSAPAYPGRQVHEGDSSEELKAWQKQMGTRGYDLVGTGYFGPKTEAAVLDLQAKSGLNVVGFIGPSTWAAAWSDGGTAPAAAAPAAFVPATDASCGVGNATAPTWPGKTFVQGDTDRDLQCFQRQLGSRGYGLTGTGYYGDATKTAVVLLQQRSGINPSGILGPLTWNAAWAGN